MPFDLTKTPYTKQTPYDTSGGSTSISKPPDVTATAARTSTAATPTSPSPVPSSTFAYSSPMSPASGPMSSLLSPTNVVSSSKPVTQQRNAVRQQATETVKALESGTTIPQTTTTVPSVPSVVVPASQDQNKISAEQTLANQTVVDASRGTPGVIQQGANGYSAVTGAGDAQSQAFLDLQKGREAQTATTQENIRRMNDAATASGVSAYFDADAGVWVNSETGLPQKPASTEPLLNDPKWGQTRGGLIVNNDKGYYGLTIGQAQAIEDAEAKARKPYQEAISDTEEDKKQGMATSLIRGGQAGGLLSTQISGRAAKDKGTTWVGAGGTMERLQKEYDTSIARLKEQEQEAAMKARNYAMGAARTGDAQYLDASNAAQRSLDGAKAKRAEAETSISKQMEELQKIRKLEMAEPSDTLNALAASGYELDSIPEAYLEDLDVQFVQAGMPPGFSSMYFSTLKKDAAAKEITDLNVRQKAEMENMKGIVDIMERIPVGSQVPIGGNWYTGFQKRSSLQEGTETDAFGKTTHWSYNPDTKQLDTLDLGVIGKPSDGWTIVQTDQGTYQYNEKTKQSVPLEAGVGMSTFQKNFPNGSQSPFRSKSDPMQGQCAAFTNDLYGTRIMGNSIQDKLNVAGQYDKVAPEEVQYGDTFIISSGSTGHIGVVLDTKVDADGNEMFLCGESNYVPPGGGQISSTRWMKMDDKKLRGIWRIPTPNLPQAGTDSTPGASGPTIGGKPIADVLGGAGDDVELSVAEAEKLGVPWGTTKGEAKALGIVPGSEDNKPLSVAEAEKLGVPFKTTRAQAMEMGITPGQIKMAGAGIDVPSFDDFASEAEKSAGMSLRREDLQGVYDSTIGSMPSYLDAAENISYKFPEKAGTRFVKDIQDSLKEGDFIRAQDKMKKAAMDTADTLTAQQVRGRDDATSSLLAIREDIADYKASGGNMNIFEGAQEKILGRAGTVKKPEQRKLATKIAGTLANYRRSISGAAFTESEGKVYESMFPSIMAGEKMNEANIQGLLEMLQNSNETFYRQQLGNENYESIFGD